MYACLQLSSCNETQGYQYYFVAQRLNNADKKFLGLVSYKDSVL
jgi:hypothetical protein